MKQILFVTESMNLGGDENRSRCFIRGKMVSSYEKVFLKLLAVRD